MNRSKSIGADNLRKAGIRQYESPYIFQGEVIGFPFSLADLVSAKMDFLIPEKMGIYHLFLAGRVVYIGMSKSLKSRLLYHLNDKLMYFDSVLWFCTEDLGLDDDKCPLKKTLELEANMIKMVMPPLNTQHFVKNSTMS